MVDCSLVTTIKNRLNHFLQTFPSAISQYGIDYELIYVNFHSNDNFEEKLIEESAFREAMFSPYLKKIKQIKLLEDIKFSPRKSKNMSIPFIDNNSNILAFSDADVFISSNYLYYWSQKVLENKTFVATRVQETRASAPCRLNPEINYGNFLVSKNDFIGIGGLDESVGHYGGDDDDVFHRLKLKGLREINPYDAIEARNYSILHGDKERLENLEISVRVDNQHDTFQNIYQNKDFLSPKNEFINKNCLNNMVLESIIYSRGDTIV